MKLPRLGKVSIDWPNHIVGFFSALFGILVAFELDQWRESVQEGEVAANAFEKIKDEIQVNKTTLHETVNTNLTLISGLEDIVLPSLNEKLQFQASRVKADSINTNKDLMVVAYVDTIEWKKSGGNPPTHIVIGNLIQPVLHYSAWESAKSTGALNFMEYERVLSISSLYNDPRITDELEDVKELLRTSDDRKSKTQLADLLKELKKSHLLLQKELEQYDLFVSFLEQME